ncbi:MAG TPA: LuxR C-terminal-related transcriptional regulator [Bacteroidales bacterium]|nr:LuxR C-terminal-related transcriptional regulator [Bacteroidales bacterium]
MLLTKLHIPPAGNNIVHRSELYEKLNTGLSRKLILVSAPAGFGKTTVVSDWIDQKKIPTAWFSLDNGDNDPADFLSYIISGIQSIHPAFGQSALKLLNSPNKPSVESIASLLINDILSISQNFLLVLDDFHLIKSYEVVNLVTYLLEHIPGNIHIVILTRSDPALSLSRLRSQHQLVELRSSDLSFSANDISVLFNKKLKLGLSIDDIYSLETKTEGWIAGLQLTALSMEGRDDIPKFIQDLKGDNRYIMDYLMEEVLKIQTDDIKEFLLQTSILEQMSASLCNAVLNRNDSQQVLDTLEKNNMFVIPLDTERSWYRYHHLFAELLKQRLQQKDQMLIIDIQNKACDWFEQNNMYNLAIEHALAIKNYAKSIQLLGEIVESMWKNGLHAAILKYGDLIPDELIKNNPEFCLYYAWILISAGKLEQAKPYLTSAENITANRLNAKNISNEFIDYNKNQLGRIFVAFAYLNSNEEHPERIIEYCEKAMENLKEENPLWFSWIWFSYGIAYFSGGDIQESNKAFKNAWEYGKKSGNLSLISTIAFRVADIEQQLGHYKSAYKKCSDLLTFMKERGYSQIAKTEWTYAGLFIVMASTQAVWANMDKAHEYIKIAYDLGKTTKDISIKIPILLIYSMVLYECGDTTGAEKKINEMEDIIKQNYIPPFLTHIYLSSKIFILIEMGQLDQAENLISEYGLGLDKKKSHIDDAAYISYARLLITQYKLDEAESLLSELFALANKSKRIERLIGIKMYYAIIYKMRGNHEKAVINVIEAMEMAENENLFSYFLFDLHHTKDLLNEVFKIQATAKTKIPAKFVDTLKLLIERKEKIKKIHVTIYLSARELDTLKLIAEDLMNQEIADKLFISLHTVKTHVKNILLKLEVGSRIRAVAKAKELGII